MNTTPRIGQTKKKKKRIRQIHVQNMLVIHVCGTLFSPSEPVSSLQKGFGGDTEVGVFPSLALY